MGLDLGILPHVSYASHKAVDVEGKQVLVVLNCLQAVSALLKHCLGELSSLGVGQFPLLLGRISKGNGQLTNTLGLGEAFYQPHSSIDGQVAHPTPRSMQVKRIPDLAIHSHTKIVAEVLGEGLPFQHFVFFVFHLLKLPILLDFCLHHPDVQVLLLRTQPVGHSLLQLFEVIRQQVRSLFAPPQSLRKIIPSPQRNDGHGHTTVFDAVVGHFGDYPHDSAISSTNDEDGLYFFLIQELPESKKAFLSG